MTQTVTVKLPEELLPAFEAACEQYKRARKPPISQVEWLTKTVEGRTFMSDCMQHKYRRLTQKELDLETKRQYYATYGLKLDGKKDPFDVGSIKERVILRALVAYLGTTLEE